MIPRFIVDNSERDQQDRDLVTDMLSPHSIDAFLELFWESRSVAVPGSRERFHPLGIDVGAFERCLAGPAHGRVQAARRFDDGTCHYRVIDPSEAEVCFAAGMTLCVSGVDAYFSALRELSTSVRRTLGLAGRAHCNGYMSPPGSGFGVHFDTQSVFILQISGTKEWRYATEPSSSFPTEMAQGQPLELLAKYRSAHPGLQVEGPDECTWAACELHPGDLLYLPAGTWHEARAADHSLGITLTCPPVSFSELIADWFEQLSDGEVSWRRNLPVDRDGDHAAADAFLNRRIEELRALVESLSARDFADVWAET